MITAGQLAQLLGEELARDGWGDIDPYWIERVGQVDEEDEDSDHHEQVEALRDVFERVVARLSETSHGAVEG